MQRNLMAVVAASAIIAGTVGDRLHAAVPVTWDGSAGPNPTLHGGGMFRWEEGNWTKDGIPGQSALATMGDHTGGRGGLDIVIGGGVTVFHDQNDDTDDVAMGGSGLGLGDFKPRMDQNGPGSLTIREGATLWLDSHTDVDGRWARMDINVNLDNGTFRTSHTPEFCPPSECSVSAGRVIFGYNNDLLPNTVLEWNITNGGRIETEGKMVWGNPDLADGDPTSGHNPGIGMNMTINDGTLDLTGGNLYDDFFGQANGEIVFFYEWNDDPNLPAPGLPKNEDYNLNFTGPGSVIVDTGIFVVEQDSAGVFLPKGGLQPDLFTSNTYEDLWALGILQANGQSGMTGATFGDYFTTTGTAGMENYTLTSLLATPGGVPADYNDNGTVDAADYVLWRNGGPLQNEVDNPGTVNASDYAAWQARFGNTAGGGSGAIGSGVVPEPAGLTLVLTVLAGLGVAGRLFRQ